ncbi:MAG TPA: response regulator [Puia sp.]|jgi:two-component system response regulator|nr:response regulator [Puia sp.]
MKPINVLLVEDNPGDVLLARIAFEKSKFPVNFHVVTDGEEALAFLYKRGEYAGSEVPDLILLDLNLPAKSGSEVLADIKNDDDLKVIPVIILTTSQAEWDVIQCYKLHANCFVNKPFGFDTFDKMVTCMEDFWFKIVRLPGN